MSKFIKRLIFIIGLLLVALVFILNIIYTSTMSLAEVITVRNNTLLFLITAIALAIPVLVICKELKRQSSKIRKKYLIFGLVIFLYVVMQVIIINYNSKAPSADQKTAYDLAVAMKEGTEDDYIQNGTTYGSGLSNTVYLERYQQQFTLAFIWSIIFRILNSTDYKIIELLNVICNTVTLISVFLISKELSKKYNVNKYLAITLIAMFWSIPVLSTFIYGDFSGISFAMLGTYFVMRYCSQRKLKYIISFIACISIAYLLRMNTLIFFIAILIYLFLDLLKSDKLDTNYKMISIKLLTIVCFIVFTFLPSSLIKNYFLNKAGLDKDKFFPVSGYVYMGMTVSSYAPGWYTYEFADYAYKDFDSANEKYINLIKERLNYFRENPQYTFKFYLAKICSMWTENNHSSIREKILLNENNKMLREFNPQGIHEPKDCVILQQKVLMLIIFGCTMLVLVQNRKNLSNELILLLTIFIGGFLFHLIWEAKSRYIIPYIIVLIPIASIEIKQFKWSKIKNIFKKLMSKVNSN